MLESKVSETLHFAYMHAFIVYLVRGMIRTSTHSHHAGGGGGGLASKIHTHLKTWSVAPTPVSVKSVQFSKLSGQTGSKTTPYVTAHTYTAYIGE